MPEIKAFNGLRYNPRLIKDFSKVLAPPYDIISPKEQEALYRANPANVIRLQLGKEKPSDNAKNNKYTRSGKYLRDWVGRGILNRDEKPSIYVYVQNYDENGNKAKRVGFIAAMKIDEQSVLKHENTLAKPKKD